MLKSHYKATLFKLILIRQKFYDLIQLMIEITIRQELETEPTLLLHLFPAVLTSDATE